jgi:sec-independent protein translocase protein TatA
MGNISVWEILLLLLVLLLVFGPKRLPEMGRSLGRGMREFKDSITGKSKDEDEEEQALLTSAAVTAGPAVQTPAETAHAPEPAKTETASPAS